MKAPPKYSLLEIERRWLVPDVAPELLIEASSRVIEDRYITGTRLRLRKMVAPDGAATFKLCKKYGKGPGLSEAVTNLYLSAAEYEALASLPSAQVRKRRYSVADGALDVYEKPNAGLAVFEMEFESAEQANQYTPAGFVGTEITRDARYSGAALAKQV